MMNISRLKIRRICEKKLRIRIISQNIFLPISQLYEEIKRLDFVIYSAVLLGVEDLLCYLEPQ